MDAISLETMREACRANGLPTSGTKPELWARLKCGKGDQRKKGAKEVVAESVGASVSVKTSTPPSPAFVSKEYAHLKASGFEDEEEITGIINYRWKKHEELKGLQELSDDEVVDVDNDDEVVDEPEETSFMFLPVYLTPPQALKSNLIIVDETRDDKGMYKYRKIISDTDKVEKVEKVDKGKSPVSKSPPMKGKAKVEVKDVSSNESSKKRKARPEDDEQPHEETYDKAGAIYLCIGIVKDRLNTKLKMGKLEKQQVMDLLTSFDAPVKGSTSQICKNAAQQLLMVTDDEGDED